MVPIDSQHNNGALSLCLHALIWLRSLYHSYCLSPAPRGCWYKGRRCPHRKSSIERNLCLPREPSPLRRVRSPPSCATLVTRTSAYATSLPSSNTPSAWITSPCYPPRSSHKTTRPRASTKYHSRPTSSPPLVMLSPIPATALTFLSTRSTMAAATRRTNTPGALSASAADLSETSICESFFALVTIRSADRLK